MTANKRMKTPSSEPRLRSLFVFVAIFSLAFPWVIRFGMAIGLTSLPFPAALSSATASVARLKGFYLWQCFPYMLLIGCIAICFRVFHYRAALLMAFFGVLAIGIVEGMGYLAVWSPEIQGKRLSSTSVIAFFTIPLYASMILCPVFGVHFWVQKCLPRV